MTQLAETQYYEQAYKGLSEEVESLVARNALAEDEAQRLSKFNAEIVGHHNPAQRILYLDRIRNELAGAKQVCYFVCSGAPRCLMFCPATPQDET